MTKTNVDLTDVLKIDGINCKGFGIIPKAVMQDLNLSLEAKTIYSYFCSLAGNGKTAFPGRDTILFHLQISKDFYYKNYRQLEDNGFVKKDRIGKFPYKNIYTLVSNPKKFDYKKTQDNKNYSQIKYSGLKAFGFGTVPRVIMVDNRLHIKAKGIYSYFCSYAGSGIAAFPKVSIILYHLRIGKEAYYKYYNQLVSCNYITVEQRKSEGGLFSVSDYFLNETPDVEIGKLIQLRKEANKHNLPCTDSPDNDNNGLNTGFSPCTDSPDNDSPDNDSPDDGTQDTTINSIITNNLYNQSINLQNSIGLIDNKQSEYSNINIYNQYRKIIAENIEYDYYKNNIYKYDSIIDDIFEILVEAVTTTKETIRVCGEDKPAEIVKAVLFKIKASHVEYVIENMKNNVTKVNNIEAYMLTALYKSPKTINSYYSNLVQYDMSK